MSANTIRHQSNSNYDMEDFINQLLASQKFDELAEKVADKAAIKIKNIETPPPRLERFSDANSNSKTNKSELTYRENNRDYDKEEYNKNTKLRVNPQMDNLGKIDTEAVMKTEASSQAENLRLKYKYLTRNAYEKKVFNERTDNVEHNPVSRNKYEKTERTSKENVKKGSTEDVPRSANTENRISNQDATEKEQHGPKKMSDEEDHNRYGNRDKEREAPDSNRNSHKHEEEARHEENTKIERIQRSREELPTRHEKETREARSNNKPEINGLVKKKTLGLEKTVKDEEALTTVEEEKQDKVPKISTEKSKEIAEAVKEEVEESDKEGPEKADKEEAEERDKEEVEEADKEESKKSTQEDKEEDGTEAAVLRAEDSESSESSDISDPDVEENKVGSSDDNLDQNEDESQETTTTTKKPITRIEGDKVYAFVDNSDYKEYHEQVAKQEKKTKVKIRTILPHNVT